MSHGQTGRLAINANAGTINTFSGGEQANTSAIGVGAGDVQNIQNITNVSSSKNNSTDQPKIAIKLNQTSNNMNNEMRYTTVNISPTVNTVINQNAIKIANNGVSGIQHGTSTNPAGHLSFHLIPLQIANVANVANVATVGNIATANATTISNMKTQQLTNDIPLTIITKNNIVNGQQNSLIGNMANTNDIAQIIGTTLPSSMKETFQDPVTVTVAGLNASGVGGVGGGALSRAGLMPNVSTTNISTRLTAVSVPSSNNSALNGSPAILIHNQLPKTTATIQRVPIASGGIASIISGSNKISSQFAINGNIPTFTSSSSSITEEKLIIQNQQNMIETSSSNHQILSSLTNEMNELHTSLPSSSTENFSKPNLVLYNPKSIVSNVSKAATIVPTAVSTISYPLTTVVTEKKTLSDIVTECILPDDDYKTAEELLQTNDISSHFSNGNIITEEIDKSDTMLIIDDSSDDEMQNDETCLTNITENIQPNPNPNPNPMSITHISNSVVLTKTNAADIRTNTGPRNLSSEPANVVLMKLPNANQQATGTNNSSVEIPIVEAFALASKPENNKTNVIKIISAPKIVATLPKSQSPTIVMRSNSVPSPKKRLSPRSAKRCQSLNYGQQIQFSSVQNQTDNLNNPVPSSISCSTISTKPNTNEIIGNSVDFMSVEPIKDNNSADVSLIELDDSIVEQVSEESNVSGNIAQHEPKESSLESKPETASNNLNEEKLTQAIQAETVHLDCKKGKNVDKKTLDNVNVAKDQNGNTKIISPIAEVQLCSNHQKRNNVQLTPSIVPRKNSEKNENDDHIIKSLLCNENIPALTTSSSSTSSTHDTSPIVGQSNARQALVPRGIRDHNRTVDANAATTRRLCRDSSIASALSMVSTFDMLNWKEDRIASARGTNMRFELNEFNLLQVHERGCPPRYRIYTPYERPIYERFRSMPKSDQSDPLLYLCRTCKLYGPAVDFLAPEFCSVECLKRNLGKRSSRDIDGLENIEKKRARKSTPTSSGNKSFSNSIMNKQLPTFRWSTYLSNSRNTVAAPIDLFLNPFPTGPNPFSVGMKVEAIDPENCSLFCVCTIVQIQGYRLRLNFDGYSSVYDFWVNADSMDIFPPGWCAKTNRILQPPRGYDSNTFHWFTYLKATNSVPADKKFFTHLNCVSGKNRNPFTVGMFLEADDLNDTGKLCVASVADLLDERIRVHFDGWDDCYDYWVDISSPYIHPCGWHEGRQQLLVPPEYSNSSFNWRDYVRESQGLAAPTDFFVSRDPIDYRPGMKLEVVDPRNPSLIRPATVIHRTRHRVKIHFDCWPPEYIFCLEDDSPDLHPIGWCDATGHELEPPPGFLQLPKVMPCNTTGCRGLGNMDRSKGLTHATRELCPYVLENWRARPEKVPRVEGKEIIRKIRQDSTSTSILRNVRRPFNQSKDSNEALKTTEKLLNIPHTKPTRGRPRKVDRLAAAAAAAAQREQLLLKQQQQEQQEEEQKQSRQNVLRAEAIKTEITEVEEEVENGRSQIKKEGVSMDNQKSEPVSIAPTKSKSKSTSTSTSRSTSPKPKSNPNLNPNNKITIAKRFLCDYGPRLQQNYVLWRQNAGVDIASKVQRNPLLWSTAETCAFIDALLSECQADPARYTISSKFYKHDIDGAALLMLQQQDLTDVLQFKLGPAIKLCEIILQLRMIVVSKYKSSLTKIETEDGHGPNEILKNSNHQK